MEQQILSLLKEIHMDIQVLKASVEENSKEIEELRIEVEKNHVISLDGIKHHGEDITSLKYDSAILNEKIDEMMIILLKRGGHINLKDILKQNL